MDMEMEQTAAEKKVPEKRPAEKKAGQNDRRKVELTIRNEEDFIYFDIGMFFRFLRARAFTLFIFLLVGAAVGVAAGVGYYFFGSSYAGNVSLVYNLQFRGIDEGLNPWGGSYNESEVISAYVLTKAMEEVGLNASRSGNPITVENIRQNLNLQGIIPHDAMNRILAVQEISQKDPTRIMDLVEMNYYPVQYKLTLQIPKGWKLSESQAKKFLNAVITNYYSWFITTYGDFSFIAVMGESIDLNSYDYAEQLEICQNRLSTLHSYVGGKDSARPDFVSPSTGLKFNDILLQINIARTVDAEAIDSLIYNFSLTKDRDRLLAIYDARMTRLRLELNSNQQVVDVLERAITEYERPQTTLIVPSVSGGGSEAYSSDDYSEYDALTRQKIEANKAVVDTQRNISLLEDRISRLNSETVINSATREKYTRQIENSLSQLADSIAEFSELTNTVAEEYYETYEFRDSISLSVAAQYSGAASLKTAVIIIGGTVLGFLFVAFLWLAVKAFMYVNRRQQFIAEKKRKRAV